MIFKPSDELQSDDVAVKCQGIMQINCNIKIIMQVTCNIKGLKIKSINLDGSFDLQNM